MDAPGSSVRDHATEFWDDAEALEVDDTLWWFVGRRAFLTNLLDEASRLAPLRRILEIGCGSGGDLELLSRYGSVEGVERSPILAERARQRGVAERIRQADIFDCELDESVDLYCLFDVLEHIEDDRGFVRRLASRGGSGHRLLISVPACPFLYSRHDELLHHHRRYSRSGLLALLEGSGYRVVTSSYFIFSLFPLVAAARFAEKLATRLGREQKQVKLGLVPGWLNAALAALLRLEARVARIVRPPIGVWVAALAVKE